LYVDHYDTTLISNFASIGQLELLRRLVVQGDDILLLATYIIHQALM